MPSARAAGLGQVAGLGGCDQLGGSRGRYSNRCWAGAALACVVLLISAASASATVGTPGHPPPADTVFRDGYVYTVDRQEQVRSSLAVRDGRIVFVGGRRGVRRYIGERTEVVDLHGRMVMPSLQDGHIHGIIELGTNQPECDLRYELLTADALRQRIQACLHNPKLGSGPSDRLEVFNWAADGIRPRGTPITKALLDPLSTKRPIVVLTPDAHSALVNSRALELAGITAQTPDPTGGVIVRDGDGEPTGQLLDKALLLARDVGTDPPSPRLAPQLERARAGIAVLNRRGVTSFLIPGTDPSEAVVYQRLRDRRQLHARAHVLLYLTPKQARHPGRTLSALNDIRSDIEVRRQIPRQVRAWRPGRANDSGRLLIARPALSIDGVKLPWLDGVLQWPEQSAATLEPYLENIGSAENPQWVPRTDERARGDLHLTPAEVTRVAIAFEREGWQIHAHAIGDRTVRVGLTAFQRMRAANGRTGSRPTLAHNELVHPTDFRRYRQLGVIASMSYQWAVGASHSTDAVKPYLGPDRWRYYEPEWYLYKARARIAYGSDCCVDPFDPWFALEAAVTRTDDRWGPEFPEYQGPMNSSPGLPLAEAIRGMTINAAYQLHQDRITGSLERGKLADLIVIDRNLFGVPASEISETKVQLTMVGGKTVHRAAGL